MMDYRKSIRKLHGGYVDWYGKPATEAQYLDYVRAKGETDVHLGVYVPGEDTVKVEDIADAVWDDEFPAVTTQAEELTLRYTIEPPAADADSEAWLFVKIAETSIPYQKMLLSYLGQAATLGNLPSTQKGLQEVPGIGPAGAKRISEWMNDNWSMPIP